MTDQALMSQPRTPSATRYVGAAVVLEVDPDDATRLTVALPGGRGSCRAELALPGAGRLRPGARVLVNAEPDGSAWVIGVLDRSARSVRADDGTQATLVNDGQGERIELRDPEGGLLFQYDPATGSAQVHAPAGDLTLSAGGAVRLHGESIDLAARSSVRLLVHDKAAKVLNAIQLGRQSTRIRTRRAELDADEADLRIGHSRLEGDRVETRVSVLQTTAERIETVAETVVQRFGSLCRKVSGLMQSRAGRLRTLVSGAWHQRAQRADLRSKETFKVDGERIHLG